MVCFLLTAVSLYLTKSIEQVHHVSMISRVRALREESEESGEEGDELEKEAAAPPVTTEDDESDHVPIVPKKRKPRKVVPVGRNGLKKRRVVKSRTTTDAKGYMRTSSCEASQRRCLILYCRDGRLFIIRVCRGRGGGRDKAQGQGQKKGNEESLRARCQGRGGETKSGRRKCWEAQGEIYSKAQRRGAQAWGTFELLWSGERNEMKHDVVSL